MLCVLYAHWSSKEWRAVKAAASLNGHTFIINPSEGPFYFDGHDLDGWRHLSAIIKSKGGKVLVYVDTCVAEFDDGKHDWILDPKSYKQLTNEAKRARAMFPDADGIFLDDFVSKLKPARADLPRFMQEQKGKWTIIMVNPGTAAAADVKKAYASVTHWLEWEKNGAPPSSYAGPFIALGVGSAIKKPLAYAHSAKDGKNPFNTLSPYFAQML